MIGIDFNWAIFVFICVPALVFSFIWLISAGSGNLNKSLGIENAVWNCEICTYVYFVLDKKAVISQCPRCASLNRKKA